MTNFKGWGVDELTPVPYVSTEELIEELRQVTLVTTVESIDPWWPMGGMFGTVFSGLPEDLMERTRIMDEVKAAFDDARVFPVDRVEIEEFGANHTVSLYGDRSRLS